MSDFAALRDELVRLMDAEGGGWTRNRIYTEIMRRTNGTPPVSKPTFYRWFGTSPSPPTAGLLACVPVLSEILNHPEYLLYQAAKVLPPEIEAAMTLASAARDFRIASRAASQALSETGLSTAGEALVVDRILHQKLDYRITVWPVVRGTASPLHLRSWIAIQPVEPMVGRQRPRTAAIERRPVAARRDHFRHEVITDGIWRSLGLRWRDPLPIEWPYPHDRPDLLLEMPVEERDRDRPDPARPALQPARILVLSAVWGHVEPLVATLAEALRWGSYDLRNQGFTLGREETEKIGFCRQVLTQDSPHYVWAIAEPAGVVRALAPDILAAAPTHLVVWVTYDELFSRTAARAFRMRASAVSASQRAVADVVGRLNGRHRVLHVHYGDADFRYEPAPGRSELDRNLLVDHVRYSAAEILNHLHDLGGPPITRWGKRFDDLRRGGNRYAHVLPRSTTVRWRDVATVGL